MDGDSRIECVMSQVCLGAAVGISRPSALMWFKPSQFTYALGFLMLSMGLTLTVDDFKQVLSDHLDVLGRCLPNKS